MAKIAEVQEVSLSMIRPYERNAKKHGQEQIEKIKDSINEFGFLTPCLIDENYNLIAGHGRVMAARELGYKTVPCVFIEGLTDVQRRAYILADNRLGELGEWDFDIVNEELTALDDLDFDVTLTGFELPEIDEPQEVQEDNYTEDVETRCKLGDIWQLGDHRLICGDSTDVTVIDRLMDGVKADLLITDPPYNVEIVGGSHGESPKERKAKGCLTIKNDKMDSDSFYEFLKSAFTVGYAELNDGAAFYVWYASKEVVNFSNALEDSGLTVKQELIWNKSSLVMGRQDYQWKHEPCLYGWKETGAHNWYGDRKQTTIIDWDRPSKSDMHPTMKPVGLFAYQIENSTKSKDNILDLFGGSGTTLIACEQLNRKCFMCELDPHYCDVIIQRWENLTGRKAEHLNG